MRKFKRVILVFIFCIAVISCAKTADENTRRDTNSSNKANNTLKKAEATKSEQGDSKLFELKVYSDKQTYKTTEKIKIWATLKYIGEDSQIKIWHGSPYISFTITDGKNFETGGVFTQELASTTLVKDKLYMFDYVKNGAYSEDDPDADFWRKFYQEKDLYLPKGEYTIKVGGAFSLTEDTEKSRSNVFQKIKIKVEN